MTAPSPKWTPNLYARTRSDTTSGSRGTVHFACPSVPRCFVATTTQSPMCFFSTRVTSSCPPMETPTANVLDFGNALQEKDIQMATSKTLGSMESGQPQKSNSKSKKYNKKERESYGEDDLIKIRCWSYTRTNYTGNATLPCNVSFCP